MTKEIRKRCEVCEENQATGLFWFVGGFNDISRWLSTCNECNIGLMCQFWNWKQKDVDEYIDWIYNWNRIKDKLNKEK